MNPSNSTIFLFHLRIFLFTQYGKKVACNYTIPFLVTPFLLSVGGFLFTRYFLPYCVWDANWSYKKNENDIFTFFWCFQSHSFILVNQAFILHFIISGIRLKHIVIKLRTQESIFPLQKSTKNILIKLYGPFFYLGVRLCAKVMTLAIVIFD